MSIRKIFFVGAIISSALISACSDDPAAVVTGPPNPVEPLSPAVDYNKGFIWSAEDGFKEIPLPSDAESMQLQGINNLGQVIGFVTLHEGQGDDRGFIWSGNDGLKRLGSLVGPDGISWPLTIDDNGEVWGLSEGPSTRSGGIAPDTRNPFVWTARSGIQPATYPVYEGANLILPPGTECIDVVRKTTAGFAVGYAGSGEDGLSCAPTYAVMWDVDGTPIVLNQGDPCSDRGCDISVSDINNHGEVVGSYGGFGAGFFFNGFRWTRSGGFVEVPISWAYVSVINDNGDAAGNIGDGESVPFVWLASGETRTMLPLGKNGRVVAINNGGQVIGGFR